MTIHSAFVARTRRSSGVPSTIRLNPETWSLTVRADVENFVRWIRLRAKPWRFRRRKNQVQKNFVYAT
jgi:hypothetical protein